MMQLQIVNYTRRPLPRRLLVACVAGVARHCRRKERAVTIVVAGEQRMRRLNREYRGKDAVTDVLSFPDGTDGYFGEIIICPHQIERQARTLKVAYHHELAFIVIHGLLHLAGFEDETSAGWKRMQSIGEKICAQVVARAL